MHKAVTPYLSYSNDTRDGTLSEVVFYFFSTEFLSVKRRPETQPSVVPLYL